MTSFPYLTPATLPPHPKRQISVKPSSFWGIDTAKTPLPTNSFWNNFVLNKGTDPFMILPYVTKRSSQGNGLSFSYETLNPSTTSETGAFVDDLTIASSDLIGQIGKVQAFDQLSVTLGWHDVAGNSLMFPLVKGSPIVSSLFNNLSVSISTVHSIVLVNGKNPSTLSTVTGNEFDITLNNGQSWSIWALGPSITFTIGTGSLQSTLKYTGTIRFAQTTTPAVLSQYVNTYAVGGTVGYSVSGNIATYTFSWKTVGSGKFLMGTLPHHRDIISGVQLLPNIDYKTIKGHIQGAVGNTWILTETLTSIDWFSPHGIDRSKLADVQLALQNETNFTVSATDSYFAGKEFARLARLILIADELKSTSMSQNVLASLKTQIKPWLDGTNSDALVYDTLWGGIVTTNGLKGPGPDFGNGVYSDHHFHYGYHLYAIATIYKHDPTFMTPYMDKVYDLVRDYACSNPNDSYFIQNRVKDWFDGHSWTSGLLDFGDGKNQESSSESANSYYAIHLLGLAIGDTGLSDWGRLLLATEIRSVQKYWEISDTTIYDNPFAQNKSVGILWSTKVDWATWFSPLPECIYGIQFIPITPIMEDLLGSKWLNAAISTIISRSTAATHDDSWMGFIYAAGSIVNPTVYYPLIKALASFDNGNSHTNMLYFGASRVTSPNPDNNNMVAIQVTVPSALVGTMFTLNVIQQ